MSDITQLAIKVDVDTERGTRIGVQQLIQLLNAYHLPATFLFSLGPDNTGRAIKRVFRKGFLEKVGRTSIVSTYGLRTLLNGVLLPGPHIGRKHATLLRQFKMAGDFEMGIHCYDHVYWQDNLNKLTLERVREECQKAYIEFERIFGEPALTAGAAGWQANANSLQAYDELNFLYASDTRGQTPFFPSIGSTVYQTLQIPSTLPTLDELIGRPEYPMARLIPHYLSLIKPGKLNVLTIHAEVEGMKMLSWFRQFIDQLTKHPEIDFVRLDRVAKQVLQDRYSLPIYEMAQGCIDGRSGTLAKQGLEPIFI